MVLRAPALRRPVVFLRPAVFLRAPVDFRAVDFFRAPAFLRLVVFLRLPVLLLDDLRADDLRLRPPAALRTTRFTALLTLRAVRFIAPALLLRLTAILCGVILSLAGKARVVASVIQHSSVSDKFLSFRAFALSHVVL